MKAKFCHAFHQKLYFWFYCPEKILTHQGLIPPFMSLNLQLFHFHHIDRLKFWKF